MIPELNPYPCPFCHEENILIQVQDHGCIIDGAMGKGRAICGSCMARGPEVIWRKPLLYPEFKNYVTQMWNTRYEV